MVSELDISDEPIWCDPCGRGHPWKVKTLTPTLRHRVANVVTKPLSIAVSALLRLQGMIYEVADRPAREAYEREKKLWNAIYAARQQKSS
jgi:hypothetical protein